jgi:hypothetical protein
MAFSDAAGNALEPSMVVDNKDKATVAEADVRKLVRDARERKLPVAVLVTRDESQLRHADRQRRWAQEEGIWLLRSTRAWLPRDLEVLRPVFERMRAEGSDFLQRNAALAAEVRRMVADIDEIEGQLKKAGTAIEKAQALTTKYRARLAGLCGSAAGGRELEGKPEGGGGARTEPSLPRLSQRACCLQGVSGCEASPEGLYSSQAKGDLRLDQRTHHDAYPGLGGSHSKPSRNSAASCCGNLVTEKRSDHHHSEQESVTHFP